MAEKGGHIIDGDLCVAKPQTKSSEAEEASLDILKLFLHEVLMCKRRCSTTDGVEPGNSSEQNYNILTTPTPSFASLLKSDIESIHVSEITNVSDSFLKIPSEAEYKMNIIRKKIQKLMMYSQKKDITTFLSGVEPSKRPNKRVHVFYTVYYGNPVFDKYWKHWNKGNELKNNLADLTTKYHPPHDIASNFFPQIGCYSSKDNRTIDIHFKQFQDTGIGVVAITWHLSKSIDKLEAILKVLLDSAKKYRINITLNFVNDLDKTPDKVLRCFHHITKRYSSHPAFYKYEKEGKHLPVYYVHDSLSSPTSNWIKLLSKEGDKSVRGTPYDAIFIGLLRDKQQRYKIEKSHFDGFYTYDGSNGISYGSSWKNWKMLGNYAKKRNLLFFPSVSPGFVNTRVNPWNSGATRHRSRGHYYQIAWRTALSAEPAGVTINSFNNWRDGSQIEPAAPKTTPQFTYMDYEPEGPLFYLNLTRFWVKQMELN